MDSKPRWESKRRDGLNSLHGLKNTKRSTELSQVNRNNDQVEGNKNTPDNILNSLGNPVEQRFFSLPKWRTMRDDGDNGFKYRKIIIYSVLRAGGLFISITRGVGGIIREIIGLFKRCVCVGGWGGGGLIWGSLTLRSLYRSLIWLLKMRAEGKALITFFSWKKGGCAY